MSVCYWLRIPEWKVVIWMGSNSGDNLETFKERMDKLIKSSADFDSEVIEQKVTDFTARDMAKIVSLVDQVWILGEWGFRMMMLMYILDSEKVKFDVIYEGEVDEDKLKSEGWHVIKNY